LGLAELSEQKKLSIYKILIYAVLFLISGFLSYKYLVAPEMKKFQSARTEYGKQNKLMKDLEEKTRNFEVLANNVQRLEVELVDLRSKVFNDENDVLTFMRSLPVTTNQTGNTLMSIVPNEAKSINVPPPPSEVASNNKNIKSAAATTPPPPPPTTLPCKLKPIEVNFEGGYGSVIDFLKVLDNSGQYMTASSMNITSASGDTSQISVKTVLNLVELGIVVKKPQIQVALQNNSSQTSTRLANATKPVKNVSVALSTQVSKPVVTSARPVQITKPITNVTKPVKNVSVALSTQVSKPVVTSARPVQMTKPITNATKLVKNVSVASSTQVSKPVVTSARPVQINKPIANVTKPVKNVSVASSTQATPMDTQNDLNSIQKMDEANANNADYSVRVGVFNYHENAQKLLNALNSNGYSAWTKTYEYNGKMAHSVYVGTFETKDMAKAFATSMKKELSYINDYVITGVKKGVRKNS
jgi:cell division septation protein DedD